MLKSNGILKRALEENYELMNGKSSDKQLILHL
jgi:hypothetical protein